MWKNLKTGKLLQIMCFQSQVFEFCTQNEALRRYTLDTSVIKCYGDVAMLTWRWNNLVVWPTVVWFCWLATYCHGRLHYKIVSPSCQHCKHRRNIFLRTCQECSVVTARPRHAIRKLEIGKTWFATTFPSLHFSIFCQITEFCYGPGLTGQPVCL
jgi:hypothetical protein